MTLKDRILASIPHRPPMRFITDILEMNEDHLISSYQWTAEDCAGHFPGFPVVPGVKLIESAAQAGCCAFALYHLLKADSHLEIRQIGIFSTIEQASFKAMVKPGDTVEVHACFGDEGYFRHPKIKIEAHGVFRGGPKDGVEVFQCVLSGMWLPQDAAEEVSHVS